ncbi:MAG: DUF2309 domain-containing protein [Isosphaeraceae bacterium]
MNRSIAAEADIPEDRTGLEAVDQLEHCIEHATHRLPAQGPITVFVHHNTLHSLEDLPFDDAVKQGARIYGCHPYLPEDFYRGEAARGRIASKDLSAVLIDDLGEDADWLLGFMGTRYHLRFAMLEHPLRPGTDAELRWLIAETDALHRFRDEASRDVRQRMIEPTRQWILRDYLDGQARAPARGADGIAALIAQFGASTMERWTDRTWESFTLHVLWRVCHNGVHGIPPFAEGAPLPRRHRDLLLRATGQDADLLVHGVLIRFCAAFLDQGFAAWPLPDREAGFFRSFAALYRDERRVAAWLRDLPTELGRLERSAASPLESIDESLRLLGVADAERGEYLSETLLALRGWAGMIWQMESNAEWAVRPAPAGTLQEYLAVRLILERLALRHVARDALLGTVELRDFRTVLRHRIPQPPRVGVEQRAYLVFQLAQVRGWSPTDLHRLPKAGWSRLVEEIESFDSLERRRIYHHAYERGYRNQTLDALLIHARRLGPVDGSVIPSSANGQQGRVTFQVVCCLDEREESFRRHLEEVDPTCETFGVAGFFGVAMYYRGVTEAHFRPLCPISIKPRHYVQEESIHSFADASRFQAEARRRLGRFSLRVHMGTRTFVGGLLTGMLGSLATIPLLMRVLLPRRTAQIRRLFGRMVTPPVTQLHLVRTGPEPGPRDDQLGYSRAEMAGVVGGLLRSMGLPEQFAPLVILTGHGSSSLNNPQEAAHDCGACGGARGGPNARAFAQMANDPRVRRILAEDGLMIPDHVFFIGAYHNTCDDGLTYYDLDRMPATHREAFQRATTALEEARQRNAHERCRRFESAGLTITPEEALRHVEGRAEDLSQTRPEYGHASNAVCFIGRRSRTRGLFLDRRTFLTSYDASQDDPESSVLTGLLRAAIPVCAGINLEYYFSRVDPTGYGCGTKLPHNITSLLGVMDGAESDLRPGLPWQMVEIHEPMRILFVVETTPEAMLASIAGEKSIRHLVDNAWVQLATLDPETPTIHVFRDGGFKPYEPVADDLPTAPSSLAWYRGWRDHLGYASIVPVGPCPTLDGQGGHQ